MFTAKRMAIACLLCGLLGTNAVRANVLTFDDLGPDGTVPNGYGGFNWENFDFLNGASFIDNPSGYQAGIVSANDVAFNANSDSATMSILGDTQFNLQGLYLTGAWNDNLNVRIQAFSVTVPVYDTTVVVSATSPTFFPLNFHNIDQVVFSSFGGTQHLGYFDSGTQFVVDNLTYSLVPEPSGAVLAGLACVAFVSCRRRLRRNSCRMTAA